jgi:hypothetical protein
LDSGIQEHRRIARRTGRSHTNGSSFDTLLAVYTGTGLSTLRIVASNDDVSSLNLTSRVSLSVKAGTTYRIAVDGWNGANGSVKLNWRLGR